jgi:hypothetical protein
VVHVAPSLRLCSDQVEHGRIDVMGYVGSFYPTFAVFYILGFRCSLVL